ncbi:hypothetical protein U1Q18_029328 [Sarracenia purpurea var. burkii]
MILHSSLVSAFNFNPNNRSTSSQSPHAKPKTSLKFTLRQEQRSSNSFPTREESNGRLRESNMPEWLCAPGLCSCRRRRFIQTIGTNFSPIPPSDASPSRPDPTAMVNSIRPPRPDWYEELYAFLLATSTQSYEAEVAGYKSQLLTNLKGKAETVLEIGIGTGPNLKYYASDNDVRVFGIDPNIKMEKYARAAALNAGLPPENFEFMRAVAEALPVSDASIDAVVGTLVLCSVKDVNMTLKEVMRVLKPGGIYLFMEHVAAKDGTIRRFVQDVLDPLQQKFLDGCHLTRNTGKLITEAGFSEVDINMASLPNVYFITPHVYGIACK